MSMEVVTIHDDIKKRINELSETARAQIVRLVELLELREYHLALLCRIAKKSRKICMN